MYERKVVARATYDEAVAARDAAVARSRGGACRRRVGPRGRRLHRTARAVRRRRHRDATCRSARPWRPARRCVTVASLDAMRVDRRGPAESRRRRAGRAARRPSTSARNASPPRGITLYPAAEPQSGTFRARVDLPETPPATGARHVRQGRLRDRRGQPHPACRVPRSSNAAKCARCTSWQPTAALPCGRCASVARPATASR